MKLTLATAEVFVPDGAEKGDALLRTTDLAVVAHPDDIEIMATEGILAGLRSNDRWFAGVVMTDGKGAPRGGPYRDHSDEELRAVRRQEQKKAAVVGEYGALVLLDHPSRAVRDAAEPGPAADLVAVLQATRPQVVYTHNLADGHDTHVAVAVRLLSVLRSLPAEERPGRVLGCEAWRDLDWLPNAHRVAMDVSTHEGLQAALLGVFDSQIRGGKRYDRATFGRRRAHATFADPNAADQASALAYAMDLTPLVVDPRRDVASFVREQINRFAADVAERLQRVSGT
jgi:LmbE family N-acetylglucosaminyl deacetylase